MSRLASVDHSEKTNINARGTKNSPRRITPAGKNGASSSGRANRPRLSVVGGATLAPPTMSVAIGRD
jgi:hypothetical protein